MEARDSSRYFTKTDTILMTVFVDRNRAPSFINLVADIDVDERRAIDDEVYDVDSNDVDRIGVCRIR